MQEPPRFDPSTRPWGGTGGEQHRREGILPWFKSTARHRHQQVATGKEPLMPDVAWEWRVRQAEKAAGVYNTLEEDEETDDDGE